MYIYIYAYIYIHLTDLFVPPFSFFQLVRHSAQSHVQTSQPPSLRLTAHCDARLSAFAPAAALLAAALEAELAHGSVAAALAAVPDTVKPLAKPVRLSPTRTPFTTARSLALRRPGFSALVSFAPGSHAFSRTRILPPTVSSLTPRLGLYKIFFYLFLACAGVRRGHKGLVGGYGAAARVWHRAYSGRARRQGERVQRARVGRAGRDGAHSSGGGYATPDVPPLHPGAYIYMYNVCVYLFVHDIYMYICTSFPP